MNRIYRLVFNPSLGQVQVAAEFARSARRPAPASARRPLWLAPLSAALLLATSLQAAAQTLPQGQIIRSGSAIINVSGTVMTIDQASRASLIEWNSFNIGAANTVQFNLLQGSQATAINLVTGSSGSLINGQLTSNGQVFLINPAGITFNAGSSVNVGGLLASTLLPGTPGLLDANGVSPTFQLAGGGTSAVVSNNGATLTALAGGISLIGGAVSNTGVISASNGNIDLVAAGAATVMNGVSSSGMSQLTFLPTAASTIAGTGISNAGVLNARNIGMNALMGPGLSSVGINTGGTIIANAIDAGDGSLTIRSSSAIQMSGGNVTARSVDLAATDAVGLAGDINADDIAIQAGSVMQTAGAVQGTLQLGTQGSVNLAQAGNRITTVGGTVGAGLTLTTSTDLTNGAALSVGGTSTLSAGQAGARRNITLTNTGNSFGGQVNATGADLMLVGSGRLGLGTIDATTLVAQGGSIGLNGAVTTTGNQTYRSAVTLTGNSTLAGSAIAFDGTIDGSYRLDVASTGSSTFSSAVGSVSPLQGLSVDAGGGIQLAGNVNALGSIAFYGPLRLVGSRSLTSTTGNMELAGTVDGDGGALSLSARNLTFGGAVGGSGAVAGLLAQATTITVGNAITSSGTIMLDGDVQLAGTTLLTSTGSGAITTGGITSTRPNGYDLGLVTDGAIHVNGNISAANVAIKGSQFSGQGITSRGNLDISTTASLAQAGAYQVDGRTRISSDGDIVLRDAGNRFSGEVSLSAVNAELHAGNLILGNSRLDRDLTLALSGGLGQSAGSMLDVGGATRIAAGTSIQLDNTDNQGRAVNRFGGPVSLSGGNSSIRGTGTLAFADLDVASVVAIADTVKLPVAGRSIGLQYYQGAIELAGDTVLDSQLGEINFQGSVDGGYALTIARALDVVFGGNVGSNRALASLDTRNGGPLRLSGNITADGAIMLGNLSLSSAIPQLFSVRSNSGSLQVGRIDGTSTGQASLALAAHGTLDLQGDAGTLAGARLNNLQLSGATVKAKAIRTSGRLDIASTSGFAQDGGLSVGGNASFTAGSGGDLTLDREPNTFGGTVTLQGRQARIGAQSALALEGIDVATLDASSTGSLSLADARIAGRAGLDAASLLIDDARIDGALVASASAGDIRQGSGSLVIGSNSQLTASNDIVLGNAGNQLGSALQAGGRDVVLTSATALDLQQLQATRDATLSGNGVRLGNLSAQGALSIDSFAAITQTDALQVGGSSRFKAATDISLDQAGNRFDGAVALDGRNVAITSSDGLLFDSVITTGDLDARAGSAGIRQQAALRIDGRSDIRTPGSIVLDRADNRFAGAVGLDGRGINLRTDGNLQVDRLGNTGQADVRLQAGGGLQLPATAIDTGTGNLTLLAEGGALQANALLAGNNVTLAGRDGVRLGGDLRSSGSLTLLSSNGDIVQDAMLNGVGGSVRSNGAVQVNAGNGRIALGNAGNQFGGALSLVGGDIDVAATSLLLGTVSAGGQLSLASAGDIRQQGSVQAAGATRLHAGGDIDLQAGGNRFGGTVTVQGRQVALASAGALQLQGVRADSLVARSAGLLTLAAADIAGNATLQGQRLHFGTTHVAGELRAGGSTGIDQDGTLRVDGSSTLDSNGAIALALSGNDLRGAVSVAGAGIDLASAGDLRIASIDNRNTAVRLQAGGALLLPGSVIDTGSADLQLLAAGALQLPAALRGNNITLRSGQDLQLGQDVLAAGVLQLGSAGALTQTGGVLAAQRLQGSANGKAILRGDNRIATLGDFNSQGLDLQTTQGLQVTGTVQAGAHALLDVRGGDLLLDGSVQAGQLRLQSTGAIRAGAGGRLQADQLTGRAAGPTMLGDASLFIANTIGTLGDFRSPAGFSLTNSGTLTLATLNGSGFSVDAGSSGFYLKVQGGDIRQLGTTPVLAGASHWWSSGGIGTQPLPIYLTSVGTGHTVDFIGRPPAYFYGVGVDGLPLVVGGGLNLPTAVVGARAQGGVLPRVAYVDMGALNAQYRAFGIVQPGIRLPADQTVACDSGDPDADCAQ